ncbi:hypothetical protein EGW08_022832 [Elysia chlorotica]|uniref:Galectin n=1 Tax=Elysia chlorotica TaxID=188477 RepID=A0A3S1B156_ELYCH|nr:hypothetical protein EGW08_022832 [Elysia chlorotica]
MQWLKTWDVRSRPMVFNVCPCALLILATTPLVVHGGDCGPYQPPLYAYRKAAGRVLPLDCETFPALDVTATPCVLRCAQLENCTVASVACENQSCRCSLCQGLQDIGEFPVTGTSPADVYILGRVLFSGASAPSKMTIPLAAPVRSGQLFQFKFRLPTDKFVLKLRGDDSILFKQDVRFDDSKLLRNSFLNGEWGEKEITPFTGMKENQEMDVVYVVTPVEFKVYFDWVFVFSFQHRDPDIASIKTVELSATGDELGYFNYLFVSI